MPTDNQQLDRELHRIAITTIIYNKDGKFLLTKRAPHKKVHPGKWTVPGGGLTSSLAFMKNLRKWRRF